MKTLKTFLIFTVLLFTMTMIHAQTIFTVNNPAFADVKVYVTNNSAFADLVVFQVNSSAYATGNRGLWCFVNNAAYAYKKVYFVNNPAFANLTIYFTYSSEFAGWKNRNKMYLML